ncbi:unnamed protein product [Closterium sp. Naga37s-1]|nr:unnamed protein product [Closterium sp. Naga37s-1]
MKCPACGSEFARMRMIKGKPAHKIVGGKHLHPHDCSPQLTYLTFVIPPSPLSSLSPILSLDCAAPPATSAYRSGPRPVTARLLPPRCRCCCHHPLPFLPATLPSFPHLPSQQPAHTSLVLGQSLQGFSPLAAAAAVTTPLTSSPSCSYPSSAASRSSTSSTSGTSSSSKGNKAGEWRVWRYLRHRWRWLSASSSLPSSSLSSSHHGQARGSSSFGLHFGLGGASLGTSSSGFGRAGRGVVVEGRRRRVRRWVVVLAATVLLVVLAGAAAVGVRRAASLIPAHDSQAMSGQNTGTVTASNRLPGFTSHVDSTAKHSGSSSSSSGSVNKSHGVAIDRGIEEEGSMLGLAVDWSEEERGRMESRGRVGAGTRGEDRGEERGEDTGEFWVRRRVGGVRRSGKRVGKEHVVRGRRRAGGRGKDGGVSGRGLQERRRKRRRGRGGGGEGKEGGRVRECEGVMVGEWPGVDGLAAVGALMAVRGRRVREGRGGERGGAESESSGGAGVGGQSSNSSGVPSLGSFAVVGPHLSHAPFAPHISTPLHLPSPLPQYHPPHPFPLPISSCAVVGPHLSHAPSAPHFGAAIDSHSLVLRMGQLTPPTRLQVYV